MKIISKYFPDLTAVQLKQFQDLKPLYEEWNAKINVISRKDIDHIYEKHILHSLGIAKVRPFPPGTSILDVGTGGGFPGVPLAVLFPQSQFFLVDSIGKKITVVKEVAAGIGLQNLNAQQTRVEDVKEKFDFVVSRAVTRLKPFYGWVKDKIPKSSKDLDRGILYLKGGDLQEELDELQGKKEVYNLSDYFKEEFFETKKVVFVPF